MFIDKTTLRSLVAEFIIIFMQDAYMEVCTIDVKEHLTY